MNKQILSLTAAAVLCSAVFSGCAQTSAAATATAATEAVSGATAQAADTDAAKCIEDIVTTQAFLPDALPEADITAIVNAGINAPSAMNGQPWHFTVVTSADTLQAIADGMNSGMPAGAKPADAPDGAKPDGAPSGNMPAPPTVSGAKAGIADAPLVIIISCKDGSDLDAGLATQNMSAEAQLLGYGTKIISSPKIALNGSKQAEYKELLGIPEDMTAVCMLLVGKTDTGKFDAVSGATARNDAQDVVTYVR